MAIALEFTVCLILIGLYDSATCHTIIRNLCLKTAVEFMYNHESCNFDFGYAQNSLEDKNSSCQTKCTVHIQDVQDEKKNILWEVDIEVDSANWKYFSPCPTIKHHVKLYMFIECQRWNTASMKQLFRLVDEEGKIALNQPCSFSEQCAGSPYASCLRGKCSCIAGYTTMSCLRGKCSCIAEYTTMNSTTCIQKEANIGATLGALFGGLLLGVILTTVAVAIIYRRSKKHVRKREELNVTFSGTMKCSSAKVVDHNTFQNIQTTDKKREESPYSWSEETSIFNHASRKSGNGQTLDDVYNHLHEQNKHNGADYYDHACAASAQIGDKGDYSHLRHVTS